MKKLFVLLSMVSIFASCKKADVVNSVTVPSSTSKKLTKGVYVYDNYAPETEEYTYDAQGRIAVFKEDERTSTFNYASPTFLVVTETKNADNSVMATKECDLNANGYITKMVFKNPLGAITYTYDFTYDADGYLTYEKGSYAGGAVYEEQYVISGGNAVSSKSYYNNILNHTREYIYDNTKLNKAPFGHAGYWQSRSLFGKRPTNLMSEYKTFDPQNVLTANGKMTYEMDADGYPTKRTGVEQLTGKVEVDSFIFQ